MTGDNSNIIMIMGCILMDENDLGPMEVARSLLLVAMAEKDLEDKL